jgi:flagellin-like hook-associated protein FlgL
MTFIPSNLARVPNLLWSRLALGNLNKTNVELFRAQQELSSGKSVGKPSDDPVKAATIGVLNERLSRSAQIARNLQHASSNLGVLDNALDEANQVALDAKSIAQTQLGITTSPEERRSQAAIVDNLLRSLFNTSTRTGPAGYLFGGSITSRAPVEELGGGYRYVGQGPGLLTDIPIAGNVPITLPASNAIGAVAARVKGTVDLNPNLTADTKVTEIAGGRGLPVTLGVVEFSFDGGPRARVDLAGSDSVGDIQTRLTRAIRQYETDQGVTVLGPGGVSLSGGAIAMDVAGGTPNPQLQFFDLANGVTGLDLGLTGTPAFAFSATQAAGRDLKPELTLRTRIADLAGVTGALGTIKLSSQGRTATIDLSGTQSVGDIKSLIEGANLGIRVEINPEKTGIDVISELAVGWQAALSIEEEPGNNLTATRLGIRSLSGDTRLSDFNDGRGVQIVDGALNPLTGLSDPSLDVDFEIVLGNPAQTRISVDLRPQDMATVQSLLTRVNAQIQSGLSAAGLPTTALAAGVLDGENGIALTQDAGFGGVLRVDARNNSAAAEGLGLLRGTYDPARATLIGEDRAKVRVDNLFTHLIDLRDALFTNDARGITLAGESVEGVLESLAETRGLVGGYAQRVESAQTTQEGRDVVDQTIRSDLEDSDFAAAATRFSLLQTQLQASLRVAAQAQQSTLLDFLG